MPLFESLKCGYLRRSVSELAQTNLYDQPFGWHLAQRGNLSTLSFKSVDSIDRTWSCQLWSQRITALTLKNRANLTITTLYHIIHELAPNLTNLELAVPSSLRGVTAGVEGSVAFDPRLG
ncbi:hypothetical protein CROQUDRAFT_671310 [Cronartium quercuum f. sp. fusiforme G11]|uniref:Uncharacterized protein n=1 Tax=Cronartium quercuum f. sp. fusiforme G11 TaxID=708437 RepID=A0A9P6NHS5_9BASI|nr:hypothetical protein CROQUDRAFT_671310 [Cronartium quercuum f. sp. fusiforme G11]